LKNRFVSFLWIACAAGAGIFAWLSQPIGAENVWIYPVVIGVIALTAAGLFVPAAQRTIAGPVRWLRGHAILYWFALLLYFCVGLGAWVVTDQPTNGRWLLPDELCYLFVLAWGWLYLLFYDANEAQVRAIGGQLGKSKLTGVMITLTTFVIILSAAETWMRIFYITTDGYGFTAMNYHWYKNFYWGHYNSVGFRDYEPKPDAPGLTRVAVLGDSFAMGHGINNIDETFPQLLEQKLGENYDVDVIAQSGWDTDIQLYQLDQYPLEPDVVVLSYYLNDIDHLLQAPELNPDSRFTFPENPVLSWVVINFFVPNYIYYNLLQFTSPLRTSNHLNDLINAHRDDEYWSVQAERLSEIIGWTERHEMRLVVLLWPHIVAIEESQPATSRVKAFFEERDVPVVDMSDTLRGQNPAGLIVNRFDSHPGISAQHLAADALYGVIEGME
jgi:hypothetical protein